jgi:hypothetical protein
MIKEISEEQRAELVKVSKGFIPSGLYIGCGAGWYDIIHSVGFYAGHHLGRWREVKEIQAKLITRGENVTTPPYDWTTQYFVDNPSDPLETTKVVQIKEKFGGLRIYYDGRSDYIDGLISMAECYSYKTCEACGKPGAKTNHGGWMATLCEEHKILPPLP